MVSADDDEVEGVGVGVEGAEAAADDGAVVAVGDVAILSVLQVPVVGEGRVVDLEDGVALGVGDVEGDIAVVGGGIDEVAGEVDDGFGAGYLFFDGEAGTLVEFAGDEGQGCRGKLSQVVADLQGEGVSAGSQVSDWVRECGIAVFACHHGG